MLDLPTTQFKSQRIEWIDILKFIAIFMMIAVHCTDNVTPAERSEPWYNMWGSFYGSMMRPAIPIFVLVTGALLIPVKQQILPFYKKRLSRLLIPFILWSVFYNLFPWITGILGFPPSTVNLFFAWADPSQSFSNSLHHILMIPFTFSYYAVQMWYVYLLIGLYLYMPFFSAWIRQSTIKEQQFFLGIWFISLFIPYLKQYLTNDLWGTCSWNEFGMLYYFAGFNGYLLLGYYLRNNSINISWSKLTAIGLPVFLIGYCVTFFGFKSISAIPDQPAYLVELFYTYCSPNVMMMTLPIVLVVQKIKIRSNHLKNFFKAVSIATFGMWMAHYIFVGPCYMLIAGLPIHTMLKMVLCSAIVFCLTFVLVWIVLKWKKYGKLIMG